MPLAESLSTLLYVGKDSEMCEYGVYVFSYPKVRTKVLKEANDVNTLILSQIASRVGFPTTAVSFIVKDVDYDYTKYFPFIPKEINNCIYILVDGVNVPPEERWRFYFTRYAIVVRRVMGKFNYAGTLFVVGRYKPLGAGLWLRRLRHKRLVKKYRKEEG